MAAKTKALDPDINEPPEHRIFREALPTMGVSVKCHKNNQLRVMARSHKTSLSSVAMRIGKALDAMMRVSK